MISCARYLPWYLSVPPEGPPQVPKPAVHFVAFRADEYLRAVLIWGQPHFIHQRWDTCARREIYTGDTVVFAKGTDQDAPSRFNGPDIIEDDVPESTSFAMRRV